MTDMKLFASSPNGDQWSLETLENETVVVHNANLASGGHQTKTTIATFLDQTAGKPEHSALLQILGQSREEVEQRLHDDDTDTSSHKTATEYLGLGGRRLAKVDDNIVSVRAWETDPPETEAFWQTHVEPLDHKQQREVALHLPSISDR